MIRKKIIAFLLMGLLGLAVDVTFAKNLKVITTNFPLYDFSRQVGQHMVDVILLLPPGVEAHSFTPTPRDVMRINQADVFVYTGKTMEPWISDILKSITNKQLLIVNTSRVIDLIGEERKEHHRHSSHSAAGQDPHFWLDPILAQKMVLHIAEALALKDSANKTYYMMNAEKYNRELQKLDQQIRKTLACCRHRTIIYGGHFAFGYFSRRYDLEYISLYKGYSPNAQLSPKSIAELIKKMKQLKVGVIYYEELIDPKIARAISEETGAKCLLLHGAHNISKAEHQHGVTYLSIMYDNLEKLKIGLEYQE